VAAYGLQSILLLFLRTILALIAERSRQAICQHGQFWVG
jgi:hypothetical protein